MKVIMAGASGLVGNLTLEILLKDESVTELILILRSQLLLSHAKVTQIVTEFEKLDSVNLSDYGVENIDVALCALGSTMKKARSEHNFRAIDCSYVLNFADFALKNGAQNFAVISAIGADSKSLVFYNKVKGEMEEDLKLRSFKTLTIIRPSLLLGERKEHRFLEKFFIQASPYINKTLIGPLKKYRGVEAKKVASLLAKSIYSQERGQIIIENNLLLSI